MVGGHSVPRMISVAGRRLLHGNRLHVHTLSVAVFMRIATISATTVTRVRSKGAAGTT